MRARRRCTREDLPEVDWLDDGDPVVYHCGRPADPAWSGQRVGGHLVNWQHPPEDIEDGCPYGVGMGAFVASVLAYQRRRTHDGNRVPNRRYDSLDPDRRPLVLDAVHYLEYEQERVASAFLEAQAEKHRSERG